MARRRDHLSQAPITEAVIDVRVRLADSFLQETLAELRNQFAAAFPVIEDQRSYEAFIDINVDTVTQRANDLGVIGLLCRSDERHEAVQVGANGYAFSKLRPYTSWDAVLGTAQQFWKVYVDVVQPETITRLGVRYINQFSVPRNHAVDRFLTTPPRAPEGIDELATQSSLTRLLLRDERANLSAHVVQVTEAIEVGTNVILDNDCFMVTNWNASTRDFWSQFAELRETKNRIFFGSITDRAAEDFE